MPDLLFLLPFFVSCVGVGVFAGLAAGMLGVGGGIILVPALYFLMSSLSDVLQIDPVHIMHVCVGTSLAIIVPTGLSSFYAHHTRGNVVYSLYLRLIMGIVLGVAAATYVADSLRGEVLSLIFACFLCVMSVIIWRQKTVRDVGADELPLKTVATPLAGGVIGFVSALVGIGGATLSVPYMRMSGISVHKAVGTAAALGPVIAFPAALGFIVIGGDKAGLPPASLGYVNVVAWGCIVPFSVLCAPLGARIAARLNPVTLKKCFAVFMMCVALNMVRAILFG